MKHLFHSIFQWFNVKQIHSTPDYMRLRESWFLIAFEMFYQCHIFLDVSINDCTRFILCLPLSGSYSIKKWGLRSDMGAVNLVDAEHRTSHTILPDTTKEVCRKQSERHWKLVKVRVEVRKVKGGGESERETGKLQVFSPFLSLCTIPLISNAYHKWNKFMQFKYS